VRDVIVSIRFCSPCLGNVALQDGSGRYALPRDRLGRVIFLPSWHLANMSFASTLLGRHQDAVRDIYWQLPVEGETRWWKLYRTGANGRRRFGEHEAFAPGTEVRLACRLPQAIGLDDFRSLMALAGGKRGLSPWKPGRYGFFEVVGVF
jgi:hypothetical protein